MSGFSLTYEKDLIRDKEQQGNVAGISPGAQMSRAHVLHDESRQLYIVSRWPKDSPELEKAVEAVVNSITVEGG